MVKNITKAIFVALGLSTAVKAQEPSQFNLESTLDHYKENHAEVFSPNDNIIPNNTISLETYLDEIFPLNNNSFSLDFPVDEGKITSLYGRRRINGRSFHYGIDIAINYKSKVYSMESGKIVNVVKTSNKVGYGNFIDIEHENGLVTRYAHLDKINVKKGDEIKKGHEIALSGYSISKGKRSYHIHIEVLKNGKAINPKDYMDLKLYSFYQRRGNLESIPQLPSIMVSKINHNGHFNHYIEPRSQNSNVNNNYFLNKKPIKNRRFR
jgi:murein DD-endopeptidase MepM/ murein hydrolase activator NlpD